MSETQDLFPTERKEWRIVDHVRMFLGRGGWWSLPELCEAIGRETGELVLTTTVSAKIRDIRNVEGRTVSRRAREGSRRTFEYRLEK